jgi:RNA polymerase sigma-70 factor (ECF subfamily)
VDPEWDCLIRAQRGEKFAWGELVAGTQPRLMALALLITGSRAVAEDVVQETFSRALASKLKHTSGTVLGFLSTIAYRLALKELHNASRHVHAECLELADNRSSPLDNLLAEERDRAVALAITNLDITHREVLVMRFYGGHSYEEIAAELGIPTGTVKSRMFYAVRACRDALRQAGVL